ncbi:hypothetical protein GTHT12_00045 [Geobacillus thermodenitrificans]|jgi:hypothetical protein|nr:hypothetical protein GTHT12_00045 [Geobacillus thermodenitrificans]KQB94206.1 putative membrane protein [Geobacillus sp. PA-3]MEC5188752.1 hypothetical protein [Geobacillus thermodenitrificans]
MLHGFALLALLVTIIWGGAHIALNAENKKKVRKKEK